MKLTEEQIEFLDRVCDGSWKLNSDGEVDVDGSVYMSYMNLKEIPVKFGRVKGDFLCSDNQLTSLKNAPTSIGASFSCSKNQLTSLKNAPKTIVGGRFYCSKNNLTNYFKNIKEEDFPHWDKFNWGSILEEYPFLINIGKKYLSKDFKYYLDNYPQTKLYLE